VDIFVGHEKDEWCEEVMPNTKCHIHYLWPDASHLDNIEAVFRHVIKDDSTKYHLYLEDDLECLYMDVFNSIHDWQLGTIPNSEAFGVFMDYKPIAIKPDDRQLGYRRASFNTFTTVMMYKDRIRDFMAKGGYPKGRNDRLKAPDHYFGKQVMQPTYISVPSMFKHIGLESAAHKRCFSKELGL
jgi:hypothetical protein